MESTDNNADRRNLVLISTIFILYHLAGGHFGSGGVAVQVVNLEFDRPDVIKIFAIIMLIWCFNRYRLSVRGQYLKQSSDEISELRNYDAFPFYKFITKYGDKEGGYDGGIDLGFRCLVGEYKSQIHYIPVKIVKSYRGKPVKYAKCPDPNCTRFLGFKGLYGIVLLSYLHIRCVLSGYKTQGYVVPYILFSFAIICSLISI